MSDPSALSLLAMPSASWRQITQAILSGDPLDVLDQLDAAARLTIEAGDRQSAAVLSATALAFMLMDWARFTDWRSWVQRFEDNCSVLPDAVEPDVRFAFAMGKLACGLLLGNGNQVLAPMAHDLESLLGSTTDPVRISLASATLLPWLLMSRNPAAAQALRAQTKAMDWDGLPDSVGSQYLRAISLSSWALHLHFTGDRERLAEAVGEFDAYLAKVPSPKLMFRRARLSAEQAMFDRDHDAAERAARDMLAALSARRPMERVIYNFMVAAMAIARNDVDRAALHLSHNRRELELADCPPGIATVYRLPETRTFATRREYGKAADLYEQFAQEAHTTNATFYKGYARLYRALLMHHEGSASLDETREIREHLHSGLAAMRVQRAFSFSTMVPHARAAVCALALRESIETQFVYEALSVAPVPPPEWADEHWPWAMTLRCFGGFRSEGLAVDGRGAGKVSNKPMSLLMLVAAHGGQGVPVALAADALWPGQDGDQAENALSVTLLRLRRMHTEADLVERRGGWLHLNPHRVWTDVTTLEAHLEALPADAVGQKELAAYIARLFDLYRGDCLFGMDDEWARGRTAHYRGRMTTAIRSLLRSALQIEQFDSAERLLTLAHERGIGATRILTAASEPGQDVKAGWVKLRQHADLLEPN